MDPEDGKLAGEWELGNSQPCVPGALLGELPAFACYSMCSIAHTDAIFKTVGTVGPDSAQWKSLSGTGQMTSDWKFTRGSVGAYSAHCKFPI